MPQTDLQPWPSPSPFSSTLQNSKLILLLPQGMLKAHQVVRVLSPVGHLAVLPLPGVKSEIVLVRSTICAPHQALSQAARWLGMKREHLLDTRSASKQTRSFHWQLSHPCKLVAQHSTITRSRFLAPWMTGSQLPLSGGTVFGSSAGQIAARLLALQRELQSQQ